MAKRSKSDLKNTFVPGYKVKAADMDDIVDSYQDLLSGEQIQNIADVPAKANATHTHDERYYRQAEIDSLLEGKATSSHTHTKADISDFAHSHDERYYTETEVNTFLSAKEDKTVVAGLATRLTTAETKLVLDKGYYLTSAALTAAHPSAEDGSFARVEQTDTLWQWDTDANVWRNTDTVGSGATPIASEAEEIAGTTTAKVATPGGRAAWWTNLKTLVQTFAARWTFSAGLTTTETEYTGVAIPSTPAAGRVKTFVRAEEGRSVFSYIDDKGMISTLLPGYVLIFNNTGAQLNKGQAVSFAAPSGSGRPQVRLSQQSDDDPCIGLVYENIPANTAGFIKTSGNISGLNTSAYNDEDELYKGPNGTLVNLRPLAPNYAQAVCSVSYAHNSNGRLHINPSYILNDDRSTNQLTYRIGGATQASTLSTAGITTPRTHTLPNKDGTFVMTSDLDLKLDKNISIDTKSNSYTLQETDNGKVLEVSAQATITLPNGLSTGFRCDIVRTGTGLVTLSATTTLRNGVANKINSQYKGCTVYHAGGNIWQAIGTET